MGKDQCRATLPEGPGRGWRCRLETGHPGWHRDCRGVEWRSGRKRSIKRRTPNDAPISSGEAAYEAAARALVARYREIREVRDMMGLDG